MTDEELIQFITKMLSKDPCIILKGVKSNVIVLTNVYDKDNLYMVNTDECMYIIKKMLKQNTIGITVMEDLLNHLDDICINDGHHMVSLSKYFSKNIIKYGELNV